MQSEQEDEPDNNPYLQYPLQKRLDILYLAESQLRKLPPSDPPSPRQLAYEATIELITLTLTQKT